jgi:S1-C subfamily serine protease
MTVARALLLIAVAAAPLRAATPGGPEDLHHALHEAGVVLDTGCSGVVAESQQLILTARHCIKGQKLQARLSTGATRTAWLVAVNEASDQAVLFLEEPAHVEPLSIARRAQIPGTVLYFEGNPGRPRFQTARLERIDRCPGLPDLPNALFTGIEGVPGDSGAPLIDGGGRVVGLVHGGVRCHIATPADTLVRLVDGVFERDWVDHRKDEKPTTLSRGAPPAGPARSELALDLLPERLLRHLAAFLRPRDDLAIECLEWRAEPGFGFPEDMG